MTPYPWKSNSLETRNLVCWTAGGCSSIIRPAGHWPPSPSRLEYRGASPTCGRNIFMTRRILAGLLMTAVALVVVARADNPVAPPAAPAKPGTEEGLKKEDIAAMVAEAKLRHERLSRQFRDLEGTLLRLKQRLVTSPRAEDREKAATIAKALEKAANENIDTKFDKLVASLAAGKVNADFLEKAMTQNKDLVNDLQALLAILTTDNRDEELRREKERIQELLKRLNELIRAQQTVRAWTERDSMNKDRLGQEQKNVTDATKNFAKGLSKDGKDKDGEGKKSDTKGEGTKKDEGDNSDGKNDTNKAKSEGKKQEGKKDDNNKTADGNNDDKSGTKGEGNKSDQDPKGGSKGDPNKDGNQENKGGSKGDPKDGNKDDKGGSKGEGDKHKDDKGGAKGEGNKPNEGSKPGDGNKENKPGEGKPDGNNPMNPMGNQENKGAPKGEGDKPMDGQKPGDSKPSEGNKPGDNKGNPQGGSKSKGEGKGEGKGSKGQQSPMNPQDPKNQDQKPGDSKGGQQGQPGQQGQQGQSKGGGQQGQQGNQPQQPQKPQDGYPGRKQVEDATKKQDDAQKNIEDEKKPDAAKDQDQAIDKLKEAQKKLEDLLRQLREEEIERLLAQLQARCERMLVMQIEVRDGTVGTYKAIDANADKKATRNEVIRGMQLSEREEEIVVEANKAIALLEAEGSAVAFAEVFMQVRTDMINVAKRLRTTDVGLVTQTIENDIIDSLKEMIEALKKAQKDQQAKKQQPPGQPPNGGPKPNDPLLDLIAELKMVRSMQLRVNNRTKTYGQEYPGLEQTPVADPNMPAEQKEKLDRIHKEFRDLSDRQDKITEIVKNLHKGKNQ